MRRVRSVAAATVAAMAVSALTAGGAWAEASTFCVKATKTATTPKHYTGGWTNKECTTVSATHEGKYEKLPDISESEQTELKELLKYVEVEASGVDGKPTVRFSGANVQIASGAAKESETNGVGNLIVGNDENPGTQSGSNNLVVGSEQAYTSYGSVLGGDLNTVLGPFSVAFGLHNTASGSDSSVSGGDGNTASGERATVSGGEANTAKGLESTVGGGGANIASGEESTVSGGGSNEATEPSTVVSAGTNNKATGNSASVSGGVQNTASGFHSSAGGGYGNQAEANYTSIFGGDKLKAVVEYESIP
jgi:hypothetical protein